MLVRFTAGLGGGILSTASRWIPLPAVDEAGSPEGHFLRRLPAIVDFEAFRPALALAHKVLADRDAPEAGDKVVSAQDSEARRGKHGDFYDGYWLDVRMDADSEIITALNVLPANGDEGADAIPLLRQEERAYGNDVAAASIDGAGYRGDVLQELTDPEGMNVEVFVPPTQRIPLTAFGPEPFTPSDNGVTRTCPAGQTTRTQERTSRDAGRKFRFAAKPCGGCPRRAECLATPTTKNRSAIENDCESHVKAAPAKAPTPAYAKVRREHPAIERKLSELVNRHAARYRGRAKVLGPMPMTGLVVNPKRLVRRIAGARERAASVRSRTPQAFRPLRTATFSAGSSGERGERRAHFAS